jgi:hypothetical protein
MKKVIAACAVLVAFLLGAPAMSNAGGWVVVSVDATPEIHAGDQVDVGFTVLRHGVTPETNDDLEIVLTDSTGAEHRFAAVPQGAIGHHVATIEVSAAGSYSWRVTGQIVEADLGRIDVLGSDSGSGTWRWDVAQWGSLTLAVAMGCLAGRDALRARRNRTHTTVAA